MTLLDEVEKFFGTRNLYEAIGSHKDSSESEIKKAYRKSSLKCHPDRVGEDEKAESTKKFQALAQIHFILADADRRKLYDDHGIIANEDGLESEADWASYWRLLFPKVSTNEINNFMDQYVGSEEELKDLIKIYERTKGDMDKIYQIHMSFDEERTTEQINKLIDEGKIEAYDKFTKEPKAKKDKRLKRCQREAVQAEKYKKEKASEEMENSDSLVAMIQSRRKGSFESMISNLERKYANPSSNKGTKRKRSNR